MCSKTPKVETPKPPPPPAPPPAVAGDVDFGKKKAEGQEGPIKKTRKKLRSDLKNPGVKVAGASSKSGLNITKAG